MEGKGNNNALDYNEREAMMDAVMGGETEGWASSSRASVYKGW